MPLPVDQPLPAEPQRPRRVLARRVLAVPGVATREGLPGLVRCRAGVIYSVVGREVQGSFVLFGPRRKVEYFLGSVSVNARSSGDYDGVGRRSGVVETAVLPEAEEVRGYAEEEDEWQSVDVGFLPWEE